MSIAPLHPSHDVEPTPIYAAVVDLHTRRPVLRLVTTERVPVRVTTERVPVRRPTPTRLAILNDGTGVTGALLWNS